MSRIRSIHPGLWTDEAFVALSSFARLLFIAMWNECDDKGTFVWSPLQLKMRCLPGDNCDAGELLSEIEAAGFVRRYEVGGKAYGAVRNFRLFQRPKTPNDIHPAPAEILSFVGLVSEKRAVKPDEFPPKGEKSPQMEDGGGRVVPFSNENGADDPDKAFWASATAYLGGSKRGLIGKWCGQYGQPATAAAIAQAQVERAVDPPAFIVGVLRAKARASPEPVVGI